MKMWTKSSVDTHSLTHGVLGDVGCVVEHSTGVFGAYTNWDEGTECNTLTEAKTTVERNVAKILKNALTDFPA